MSPRLRAALRELNAAVEAEIDEALACAETGRTKAKDELAQRAAQRAIEGLKKRGMLPTDFRTAKR